MDFDKVPSRFRFLAKYFLWALEYVTDSRINRLAVRHPRSFYTYYLAYRDFARRLDRDGVVVLSSLSCDKIEDYFAEMILQSADSAGNINFGSYSNVYFFFQKLYRLGPHGNCTLPDGLSYEVSWKKLPHGVVLLEKGSTPIMPEAVALSILRSALSTVTLSRDICEFISMHRKYRCYISSNFSYRADLHLLKERQIAFLRDSGLESKYHDVMERLKPLLDAVAPPPPTRLIDSSDRIYLIAGQGVHRLISHLISACYCLIAGFTGFRYSEIMSIKRGSVSIRGSRAFITTLITKTTVNPNGVLVDRFGPQIIFNAYEALLDLNDLTSSDRTHLWNGAYGAALTNSRLTIMLNRFVAASCDRSWHLTSHQFRRFFAIFYIRRFQGSEDELRRQYRHVSYDMIQYYVRDKKCASFLIEAEKDLLNEVMDDLVFGKEQYIADQRLTENGPIAAYRASNLPIEEIEKALRVEIDQGYSDIRPNPWGYCVLQKNDTAGAVCGGQEGLPEPVGIIPENCIRCKHLVIGKENLGFWEHTRQMHNEVVHHPASPQLAKAASLLMIERIDSRFCADGS